MKDSIIRYEKSVNFLTLHVLNYFFIHIQGGKADDISVIVAIVKDCEDSPDRRL